MACKKICVTIRKQLGYVCRDLGYLEEYMTAGYALPEKYIDNYLTIITLYKQQKNMFDNKVHSVPNYDVSIDEKGHARLEKIMFDSYKSSRDKRCNGAGLIMVKPDVTALSVIALSVLVTNLFSADIKAFFILYFMPDYGYENR